MKSLTKKEQRLVDSVAQSKNCVTYPNYYNGSGRWTRRSADYASDLTDILTGLGMVRGKHFERGNDAPNGGWTGEFVKLLPAGKRWKVIQESRRQQASVTHSSMGMDSGGAKTPASLSENSRSTLISWVRDGALHPCSPAVLAIKSESGLSWKQVAHLED